ncbi:MAG: Fic family protein [Bacteroidales bacterium]|nr:Fic family protein [Bacteroidales bacterium]
MLADKKKKILEIVKGNSLFSSKEIYNEIASEIGYSTVKRILSQLISENLIIPEGKGKARKYAISPSYELFYPIDVKQYFEKEIDDRIIKDSFNLSLINDILYKTKIFTADELQDLTNLQKQFMTNISELTDSEYKKEFERLAIDLSWKSSQIEGNTYSLLETERLLKDKETAHGKTKDEAIMLLNHKEAIDFIMKTKDYFTPLTISGIEDIHSLLVKDLSIGRNIRKRRVGISGTNYKPLDNEYQIKEALTDMCKLINNRDCIFEKALLSIILLSYIQAFGDGNKRTARIISNALLINYGYCPISFRTIDSVEYKKAMLIFYEQNNLNPFKEIFINQLDFAVKTYF